jgi:hypothetical protein
VLTSSALYVALDRELRSGTVDGEWFATGGRTRWRLQVSVAAIGTSVDVELQGRAVSGMTPRVILDEQITVVGEHEYSVKAEDFDVRPSDEELRVCIVDNDGDFVLGALIAAPFLDPSDDSADRELLTPRLRTYDEIERLVLEAEDDVLNRPQLERRPNGVMRCLDMTKPRFLDQMQLAIARQAERRYMIDQLREAGTAEALDQLSKLATVTSEVDEILSPYVGCPDEVTDTQPSAEGWLTVAGRADVRSGWR